MGDPLVDSFAFQHNDLLLSVCVKAVGGVLGHSTMIIEGLSECDKRPARNLWRSLREMLNWVHARGVDSPRKKASTACTRWSCVRRKVAAIACMRILSLRSSEATVIISQKTLSAIYLCWFEPNFE
jgi:hypothetical protein